MHRATPDFLKEIAELDAVGNARKWVRVDSQRIFISENEDKHSELMQAATDSPQLPIDAGSLMRSGENEIAVFGWSLGYKILEDNPERPFSIELFRGLAAIVGIEIYAS